MELQSQSSIIDFGLMKGEINTPYAVVPHRVKDFLILAKILIQLLSGSPISCSRQ